MAIDYATKYSELVDERFQAESKSERCVNRDYDFVGTKTVKVYNIATAPMKDYARTGVSRYGTPAELDATTQELTMTKDRSFTFTIDKLNADETGGALNAGKALARQLREVITPEIDKYRYEKMAKGAGTKATPAAITATNVYQLIAAGVERLDEAGVPQIGRFMIVSPATYTAIKASKDIVLDCDVAQDIRATGVIATLDGLEIIKVPASMLPTKTGFILGHSMATTAPIKLAEYRVHEDAPGVSGSLVEGRVNYDAFVFENKKNALYVHNIA